MKPKKQYYALVYYPTPQGRRYVSLHPDENCTVIVNARATGRYLGVFSEDALADDAFWESHPYAERGEDLSTRIQWAKRNRKILLFDEV